jgi:hypothetical protein
VKAGFPLKVGYLHWIFIIFKALDHNIISLGSDDCLIDMDWLKKNHVILYCYNKDFTCLDKEGNSRTIQGIQRPISIRDIS